MRWSLSLVCGRFRFASNLPSMLLYKGRQVGLFVPDLIAFDTIVVDTKVLDRITDQITDHEKGLMLNHLRITNSRVGVILNFKRPKLERERIVL